MKALCINEKMNKLEKFIHIITQGEKIQKWSVLENMNRYIDSQISAEKIIFTLEVLHFPFRKTIPSTNNSFQSWAREYLIY